MRLEDEGLLPEGATLDILQSATDTCRDYGQFPGAVHLLSIGVEGQVKKDAH